MSENNRVGRITFGPKQPVQLSGDSLADKAVEPGAILKSAERRIAELESENTSLRDAVRTLREALGKLMRPGKITDTRVRERYDIALASAGDALDATKGVSK